jgi:tetratricopeptide (TPR) repeat protein
MQSIPATTARRLGSRIGALSLTGVLTGVLAEVLAWVPAGAMMAALAIAVCPVAANGQITAQTLVGKAVSDDAQYADINSAIARFRDRDLDGCRALMERARSNNPKLPPPGVMMAMLWLSVNQLGPARAELEDTAVKFAADPEPYLLLGDLAFQDRRITDASVLFDKANQLTAAYTENPKRKRDFDIRGHAGTAAVAEARKQWEKSEKELRAWMELDPDNSSAHQRLGIVLYHLGKPQDALEQFREAKKLDDKSVHPELAMARLYDEAKKRDTSRKLIEQAVKSSPQDPAVLLAAAQWYLGQNDLATATIHADNALKLDPKSLEAKVVRGAIARVSRDYKVAERYFNEAHVQSPGNFPSSNSLALVLVEGDDKADRQRALEMAEANVAMQREGSPFQVTALTTLAWVFYKVGRREDAEKILSQITQSNQLSTDGAYYVAKILADRGEKDRARKILEEVLASEALFATRPDAVDLLDALKKDK